MKVKKTQKEKITARFIDGLLNERCFIQDQFSGDLHKTPYDSFLYCITLTGYCERTGKANKRPIFVKEKERIYVALAATQKRGYARNLIQRTLRHLRNQKIPYTQVTEQMMALLSVEGSAAVIRLRIFGEKNYEHATQSNSGETQNPTIRRI